MNKKTKPTTGSLTKHNKKDLKKEFDWEEELFELAEKYCKHDDREMNSCLYWIFRPVIVKALKAKDKEFIEILDGLEMEEKTSIHSDIQHPKEYNQAVKKINNKIKQIKKKYEL